MKLPTFQIEELKDSYRLHNVPMSNGFCTLDWSKDLLDDGNIHTQDEWTELLQNEKFKLPSGLVYYAAFRALHSCREGRYAVLARKIGQIFAQDFKHNWMTTSTRIRYNPSSPDTIIHDYGKTMQKSILVEAVGPSGYLALNKFEDILETLIGTRDYQEVDDIIGRKTCFNRVNSRPEQVIERVLVLGLRELGPFSISIGDLEHPRKARGVAIKKYLEGGLSFTTLENIDAAVSIAPEGGKISLT